MLIQLAHASVSLFVLCNITSAASCSVAPYHHEAKKPTGVVLAKCNFNYHVKFTSICSRHRKA